MQPASLLLKSLSHIPEWLHGKPSWQIKQAQRRDPGIVILTVIMPQRLPYYLLLHSEEVSYLHSIHINVWKPNLDREITSLTSSLCVGFKWQMTAQQCRTFQVNNKEYFLRQVVFYQACFSCLFVWVQRLEVARRKKKQYLRLSVTIQEHCFDLAVFFITILKLLPYCHIHFRSNKYLYLFIIGWSLDFPMLGLECIKWI